MNMPRASAPRPSANRCLACWCVAAGALALVGLSFWSLDLQWAQFVSAPALAKMGRFLAELLQPETSPVFLQKLLWATLETLAMSALGTLLAVPLALLSVRVLSISALTGPMAPLPALVRLVVRWLLVVLRSVPELIWALVFVRVVGLGPTAGVLAIALTFAGMLGKVYAEILDSAEPHAAASLLRNGSGRLQAFLYALLPQNAAELTSYTVYRWECAIRSSAVLGFVGAGGLGQQMDASMKMFEGAEVATMLLVFMALVWLADRISAWLRQRLA